MTDTAAALVFLENWEPNGPWVLTAIAPDRHGITTATFAKDSLTECSEWIEKHNGKRNLYFHVNPTVGPMDKKAQREDIKAMKWLHVDVDPRVGEDLDLERERALNILTNPPIGIPKPTVIIFSGGGYQGFWRLEDPVEINGDLGLAEDAKRFNLQLEILFGGDNCHNVDRIMRLPGSINIPDAKKKAKGRTRTLATTEVFDHSRIYPLSDFTAATPTQAPGSFSSPAQEVAVSGNVARLDSMDELDEWDVPDRVKVIIVQGRHPDEGPKEDDSRSSWLFDCVCNLVRCKVPDEVIFSIITDKNFGISESVLDKGSNIESYAIRQIGKGKEFAINPALSALNERYAVISNVGGKCRVVEEQMDPVLKRSVLTLLPFGDFKNAHMNKKVQIGLDKNNEPRYMPLGDWWLKSEARRQFERIVFVPNREVPDAYNLWKGYACQAIPGEWDLLNRHIKDNVCQGKTDLYEYLIGWMARTIQKPGEPGQVAVVMRGEQGTGKSFIAKQLGSLLGRHYLQVGHSNQLVGNFNAHLRDCVLLFADEAFYAGDKRHEGVLKMIVTEDIMAIESKGVDVQIATNCLHLMMASNKEWVVPAHSRNERRFFVLDVGDAHQMDTTYFRAIQHQMDNGGREAMLHYLLNYDLKDYNVRAVPKTEALAEQQRHSYSSEEQWWFDKLVSGWMLDTDPSDVPWPNMVLTAKLYEDYLEFINRSSFRSPMNQTHFGRFMSRAANPAKGRTPAAQGRRVFYTFANLEVCRRCWEDSYGPGGWELIDEVEMPEPIQQEVF